ncbi:MAG: lysophospholipid acyltransferase family protein [Clostridiales bacterium]|jgi:1-acyl-sn-glycerol-3-phosphate acyltransferase|nr:1-acyl-sn-glycerol-3-phosphate acyltransferase [Eubacteriales bacterium]MDH7565351.1 lysophospholipid acyltransferase family protein [Clostridiales bacterium]
MRLLVRIITTAFFKLFYKVEVVNRENVPQKGGAVLCSNHVGVLDMFFIGYKLNRWIYYMAKEELFKIPVLRLLIRQLGAFPVKREKGDVESIKTALKLIGDGHIVGIFPEGTRTSKRKEGKMVKPKPGAALLAVKTGVPVIPVAIQGRYKLFSNVKVIFGEPIKLDASESIKYTTAELTDYSRSIMEKIYALMGEGQWKS